MKTEHCEEIMIFWSDFMICVCDILDLNEPNKHFFHLYFLLNTSLVYPVGT